MEEKVKSQYFKPDHNNKFYKKVSEKSNKSLQVSNYTVKDNSDTKRSLNKFQSGRSWSKELNHLQMIVSEIKEYQTGKNCLKFVDDDINDMKNMLGSLNEIIKENRTFVEKFDEEFDNILKKEYLIRSNRSRKSVPRRILGLKKNQSENTVYKHLSVDEERKKQIIIKGKYYQRRRVFRKI